MTTQRPASRKRPSQRPGNGQRVSDPDAPGNGHPNTTASTGTLPVRTAVPGSSARLREPTTEEFAPATTPLDESVVVVEEMPAAPRSWLTLENGLYLLFFIAAVVTRFWGLGEKGLHHDESLHAVFSWRYYIQGNYIHSPMMHGPEQFHFIDLFYLLFGATDATSRFASAVCGVFIVMAPLLLRRQIGRWPALIASFLFLISPGFMYFTRFAREDSIYAAMEMLFMVGLWRFIDERKPRDFYMACAGYSLMFTIKETAYLTTAVLAVLLVGLFAWQIGRWLFITFVAYAVAVAGMALIILRMPGVPHLPGIPAVDPTPQNIQDFVTGMLSHPLIQVSVGITLLWLAVSGYMLWDQSRRVRQAALAELEEDEYAAAGVYEAEGAELDGQDPLRDERGEWVARSVGNGHLDEDGGVATLRFDQNGAEEDLEAAEALDEDEALDLEEEEAPAAEPRPVLAPVRRPARRVVLDRQVVVPGLLERYQPGSLPYAVGYLLRNPHVLGLGLAVAALIYVALYTSMFTNINGLGTGMFGSIGYWIAQHDVRRGDQPWFYYIVLIPIYDILPVIFGFAGMFLFGWRGLRSLRERRREPREPDVVVPGASAGFNAGKRVDFAEFRPFAALFLAFWFVGVFGLYSWAGEKMPWLMVHMVQPLIFLAALFLGQLVTSMIRRRRERELEADEYAPADGKSARRGGRGAYAAASPWAGWSRPTSWVPFWSFVILFSLIAALGAMNISLRVVTNQYDNWWQLLVWPALMIALTGFYWAWVGGSRALRYAAVGLLVVLLVYTTRSAFILSYHNEDTPREMAVYVQTSPDVTRMVDQVNRLSVDQTGGKDLKVMYDSETSWPMEWYFRDYKNKIFNSGGPTAAPAEDVAVLVVHPKFYDQAQSGQAPHLDNYVATRYVMRWWFPEETYRVFVPDRYEKQPLPQATGFFGTIWLTLTSPADQGKLWKFLIWREPYAPLGSTDMAVFVRKDLFNRYNFLAQLEMPNYDYMAR